MVYFFTFMQQLNKNNMKTIINTFAHVDQETIVKVAAAIAGTAVAAFSLFVIVTRLF